MENEHSSVVPSTPLPSSSAPKMVYSVDWKNRDKKIFSTFKNFLSSGFLTDLVLSCDTGNKSIRCHKLILAAASNYFEEMIRNSEDIVGGLPSHCQNWNSSPFVVIKDATFQDLEAVMTFIYEGQVVLEGGRIPGFLKAAQSLKIKGIVPQKQEQGSRNAELGAGGGTTKDPNQLEIEGEEVRDVVVVKRVENSSTNRSPLINAVTRISEIKADHVQVMDRSTKGHATPKRFQRLNQRGQKILLRKKNEDNSTKTGKSKCSKYKLYDRRNISEALEYMDKNDISCEKAAKLHGIPYRTLYRHRTKQTAERNGSNSTSSRNKRVSTGISSQTTESCEESDQSDLEDDLEKTNSKRPRSK